MVEYTNFEGHVTHNDDEYQKSVQLKFRQILGVSEFTISLFVYKIQIPAEEIDFKICHFCNFSTSVASDQVIRHIDVYQQTKFW